MTKINIRKKGQRAEREVIELLQPIVDRIYTKNGLEPPLLQRNTLQSHAGGYDIVGLDWLALEVKFQETEHINTWWAQAKRQAKPNQVPVLIWRKSRAPWQVKMVMTAAVGKARIAMPVVISLESFLLYFEWHTSFSLGSI